MQRRTQLTFERWYRQILPGAHILSYSPLLPRVRVAADGASLEYEPESVSLAPPINQQQLEAWLLSQQRQQQQSSVMPVPAAGTGQAPLLRQQGVWPVARFMSLLLGEIPRLRDDTGGYGPRGRNFIDHTDVPEEVEAAWQRLSARYPHLLRAC